MNDERIHRRDAETRRTARTKDPGSPSRFPRSRPPLRLCVSAVNLLLLSLAACSKPEHAPPSKNPSRTYRVTATTVAARPLTYSVEAIGALEAHQVVVAPARVEGALDSLDFDEGSVVTPDTVLAVVDERRYSLVVAQEKAAVAEAQAAAAQAEAAAGSAAARTSRSKAEHDNAAADYARWKSLREKNAGFVTEEKLLGIEATVKSLAASVEETAAGEREAAARVVETRAAVETKRAAVAIAEKNVADARVRPPIAGVVEKRHVAAGQYVKVGDPIATLVDTSRLRLRFAVGEAESVRLRIGQPVSFRVKPFPEKTFQAELFHVGATADPATRMLECLATVTAPDPGLHPGFFARVEVEVSKGAASIVVPEGALLPTEKGFVAFVEKGGKASRRLVTLGLHTRDGNVEVLSGLAAGETLIVNGAQSLDEGVAVEVVDEGAKQ
jgi:multidrug efflux system membrane fusion protein